MIYKKVLLKDIDERFKNESATLRIFISNRNESVQLRPGILVCPGGGYGFCSEREAEPIAFRFLSEGFNCFVLTYSCNSSYPTPHLDLALAISYIRTHEKEFDLIPDSLSIIGFSAGGHLVASYSYLYKELAKQLSLEESYLKPFSIILGYPVITLLPNFTHKETSEIISNREEELLQKLEVVNHIEIDYPPTFIWTTFDDPIVPAENTMMMEKALKNNNVPYKCIIFKSGWHGSSLSNRSCYRKQDITKPMKDIRDWASVAADFIFDNLNNRNAKNEK